MTFSITTGMHDEIIRRIKVFSYPYQITLMDDNHHLDLSINHGISQFCIISSEHTDKIVKINLFNNTDSYLDELKTNNYIIRSQNNNNSKRSYGCNR